MDREDDLESILADLLEVNKTAPPPCASTTNSHGSSQQGRSYRRSIAHTVNFDVPSEYSEEIQYLGGGSYGNVIKCSMRSRDGMLREVAIKKMYQPFSNVYNARRVFREMRLLQMMKHDNVIRAVDLYSPQTVLEQFKDVYIVTEYAGNSLHDILKAQREAGQRILNSDHIRFIIYQLLRAVKYIHSAKVMHRDLKPGNLALTQSCDLTVLDFGLARTVKQESSSILTTYVMTRWYRSPEVMYWNIDSYDTKADIWSVGCIAAELMTNAPLFPGTSDEQYDLITRLCGSPDEILLAKIANNSDVNMRHVIEKAHPRRERQDFRAYFEGQAAGAVDFLDRILVLDPERRMSVEDALKHEYMREYHLPTDEPTAPEPFVLDEEGDPKTLAYWKSVIWSEIQNFAGDEHSPMTQ